MKYVYFTDTEGHQLPTDDGRPTFGVDLVSDAQRAGELYLGMSVPMYFETLDGQVYNSAGVLTVDLRPLLESYLDNVQEYGEEESLQDFSAMLTDFAQRADDLRAKIATEPKDGAA
jgi:hypothetical protein